MQHKLIKVTTRGVNSLGHQLFKIIRDEYPSDIQLQAGLVLVVVVHEVGRCFARDEQDGLELHIAFCPEMGVGQWLVCCLHSTMGS